MCVWHRELRTLVLNRVDVHLSVHVYMSVQRAGMHICEHEDMGACTHMRGSLCPQWRGTCVSMCLALF